MYDYEKSHFYLYDKINKKIQKCKFRFLQSYYIVYMHLKLRSLLRQCLGVDAFTSVVVHRKCAVVVNIYGPDGVVIASWPRCIETRCIVNLICGIPSTTIGASME